MSFRIPATRAEWGYLLAVGALLVGAHLVFGALNGEAAATVAFAWSALLLVGIVSTSRLDPRSLWPLAAPALGFAWIIGGAAISLTDWVPGTAQPIWRQVGLDPAATVDRSETWLEIVKLCGLAMTFLVGWGLGGRETTALRAFKVAAYSGAVFAAIAIIMHVGGFGPKTQAGRLEAVFLNPNTAGACFGVVLCLCVGLAFRALRQARDGAGYVGLGFAATSALLAGTALVMTLSRGAIASTTAALVIMILARAFTRRWSLRRAGLSLGVFLAGAMLLAALLTQFSSRLPSIGRDALLRRYIFDSHWQAFTEAPVLGYGLGSFDTVNRMRLTAENFAWLWNIRSAENVYLQWLVEGGLLLALPMFATIAFIVLRSAAQAFRRRAMLGPLHALLATDLVLLLHGIFDFALQTYSIAVLWSFLLGLQFSWGAMSFRRGGSL